jgi:NAD(P)-dependent dehydrogenase (short-subunit alcohol dehydrogenase family)
MKVSTALKMTAAAAAMLTAKSLLNQRKIYDLKDRVILITGGSRGLGLVLARAFANEGAKIVVCARDESELRQARIDLERYATEVLAIKCDVTIPAEVKAMIDQIHKTFGRIDVLVNNAGIIQVGPLEVITVDDYRQAFNTHFWGPLNTILAVLPGMKLRRTGRIVNISSVGGKIAVPHLVPYSASKFALVGFSKGLRAELAKDGILVTTVCPGLMRTGSPRNAEFKGKHRAEYAWFSISDSLPFTSIKAERAAEKIIDACKSGRAELIISIQAKAAVVFDSLFPELSSDLMQIVNRLLPEAGGIGESVAKGRDSKSSWSPSWLTTLNEAAALRNNEMAH